MLACYYECDALNAVPIHCIWHMGWVAGRIPFDTWLSVNCFVSNECIFLFIMYVILFLQRCFMGNKHANFFAALYACTLFMCDYQHGHHSLYTFALRMVIISLQRQRVNEHTFIWRRKWVIRLIRQVFVNIEGLTTEFQVFTVWYGIEWAFWW